MSETVSSDCSFVARLPIQGNLDLEGFLKSEYKYFLIQEVRFDDAVYPFVNPVYGCYELVDSTFQVCFADIFLPIVGKGKSFNEAKHDWERQFHLRFHELYVKCWWERNEEEQKDWKIFEDVVDIPAFRKATPLKFTEIGKIISIGQIQNNKLADFEIEWLDGQKEILDCAITPEFTTNFVLNCYYEIKLLRNYQNNTIVKVIDAAKVDYKENSKEEIEKFDTHLKEQINATNISNAAWITLTMQE
jgi:hypothetical protein